MPPKKSRKDEEDDDYVETLSGDDSASDIEEPVDDDGRSTDDDDDEEEEETEDKTEQYEQMLTDFRREAAALPNLKYETVIDLIKRIFVSSKIYDKFVSALEPYSTGTTKLTSTLLFDALEKCCAEIELSDDDEDDLLVNDLDREKTILSSKTYPSLFSQVLTSNEKTNIIGYSCLLYTSRCV